MSIDLRYLFAIGLFLGTVTLSAFGERQPETADLSVKETSKQELYQGSVRSKIHPIPIGEIHDWIVELKTISGEFFSPTQLVVQGGMPGHGHGFPVAPKISRYLGNGRYLIEGVKFNMAGEWQLRIGVEGPSGWDTITFPLKVEYEIDKVASLDQWSPAELAVLKSLTLSELPDSVDDPSNRYSGNIIAAELGEKLFFDKQLSASGEVSCASCHQPEKAFSDGNMLGFGSGKTIRHTPGLLGVAHNQWFYWDGRRDSLWAQAVTPIESRGEMDNNRVDAVEYFFSQPAYVEAYKKLTGTGSDSRSDFSNKKLFPSGAGPYSDSHGKAGWSRMSRQAQAEINQAFANIGKFIAAYEQSLQHRPARFDNFVEALLNEDLVRANQIMDKDEQAGLRLFIDREKTQCLRCHNGPLFTNHGFHNIGSGIFEGRLKDYGRYFAIQAVAYDIFNCEGEFSDAQPDQCSSLRFMQRQEIPAFYQGAFKVPGLRAVTETGPYLHDGRYDSLAEVIKHYRDPPQQMSELNPVELSDDDINLLVDFLGSLAE